MHIQKAQDATSIEESRQNFATHELFFNSKRLSTA
jgi:hypothetical protein